MRRAAAPSDAGTASRSRPRPALSRSEVEAEAQAVEGPQPQVAAALVGVGSGHRPLGEPDAGVTQWFGRERDRPLSYHPEPRSLGVLGVQQVELHVVF